MPALHCIPAKSLFLELWQHQSVLALVTGDQRLFIFSFCTKFGFSCQAIKRPAPWAMQVGPAVKRPRGAITWGVGAVGHMGHMGPVVPVGPGGPVGLPGTWGAMSPFGAGWEPDKALCVVHNKVRSVGSMAQSGIGQWVCLSHLGETFFCFLTQVCRPDSQCKTGVPGADGVSVLQCAIHNRTRAANYLDLGTGFVSHVFWETSLCGTRWPLPMQTWSRVQGEWEGCLSLDSFSVQFHQLCVHCIKGCITRLTRRKLPLAASPGRPNALFCTLFLLLLCLLS